MRYFILSLLIFISTAVQADETYVCRANGAVHTISVVHLYVEQQVPCEVRYFNEAGEKVLWSAKRQAGYCEEKAKAFVEKHRAWGWSCQLDQ